MSLNKNRTYYIETFGGGMLAGILLMTYAEGLNSGKIPSPLRTVNNGVNTNDIPRNGESGTNPTIARLDGKNFPTMGEVTISKTVWLQQFKDSNSPIPHDEASAIYDLAVAQHVDPNFLLAIGIHESGLGKNGIATTTKSFCNMRPWWDIHTQAPPAGLSVYTNENGSYVNFSGLDQSWYHGADACINAIVGWSHIKGHTLTVAEQVTLFAPPEDKNNTLVYISAVEGDMMRHNADSLPSAVNNPRSYVARRDV